MKIFSLFSILLVTIFLNAEQSVYSDSDFIDADTIAKKNSRELFILKQKISQLQEIIDGLKSLVKSQSNQIEQLKQKIEASSNLEKVINQLSQRVATLESKPFPINENEKEIQKDIKDKTLKPKKEKKEKKIDKKISSEQLYKDAVLNFTKSKLTKAQQLFKELLKRSYKSASVNFYLGEIAYKKGRYKEAISYYQNSATLNENANYMDKLLLHTAVSLNKKGKSADAKVFFKAVIDSYPNSNSAKEAKIYLKK